jgi:hypothetical protein
MRRRVWAGILILSLSASQQAPLRAQAPDPELENGIRQAQEGDYEAALLTLDAAVRRLANEKGREKDLSRGYLYLSVAYFGLGQQEAAKARFREAWKAQPGLQISASEFPPRIFRFLQEARSEAEKAAPVPAAAPSPTAAPTPATRPTPAATPQAAPSPAAKKGGGSKALIILGVGAALAAGAAAAAGGGGGGATPAPTPAPTPEPRGIAFLGSTPAAGGRITVNGCGGTCVSSGFQITMAVKHDLPVSGAQLEIELFRGGTRCAFDFEGPFNLVPGQQQNVVHTFLVYEDQNCPLPATTDRINAILFSSGFDRLNMQSFSVGYSFSR